MVDEDTASARLEPLARKLCEDDGDDPDRKINVVIAGKIVGTVPLWTAYLNAAGFTNG